MYRRVRSCNIHSKYTKGCDDCKERIAEYRKTIELKSEKTHYKNGQPKKQGIRSDENIIRFNDLGKTLTNEKDI